MHTPYKSESCVGGEWGQDGAFIYVALGMFETACVRMCVFVCKLIYAYVY